MDLASIGELVGILVVLLGAYATYVRLITRVEFTEREIVRLEEILMNREEKLEKMMQELSMIRESLARLEGRLIHHPKTLS